MNKQWILISLTALLLGASSYGKSRHEHHKAHVHGEGKLNIAIEKSAIFMELEIPAMDIVGFEHEAHTKADQKKVTNAVALLKKASTLLMLPKKAQCHLAENDVESGLIKEKQEKHHDHHDHHDDHGHHDDHEEKHEQHHSEFHISSTFQCKNIKALHFIEVKLFQHFPHLKHIEAQVLWGAKQKFQELEAKRPRILLK